MAYDINVFIQQSSKLELLHIFVNRFNVFAAQEGSAEADTLTETVFGIHLSLVTDHGLEDDCGIAFSRYGHQVGFTLYAGRMDPTAGQALCRALATAFAHTVANELHRECLIVEGVERVLEEVHPSN